jgi:phosphomevalonate kinase
VTREVFAPGKMVLTGAYAVLRGAPALVVAVSRGAIATDAREAPATPEVAAALGVATAPALDLRALFEGDRKLGLGASAAGLVATLGLCAALRGERLDDASARDALFRAALAAHRAAQGGGSGVDVAASVYGGVLEYTLEGSSASPEVTPTALPPGVTLAAYAAGASARTSDLRRLVDGLCQRSPERAGQLFDALGRASFEARDACRARAADAFLASARAFASALAALGAAAEAPIVSAADRALAALAAGAGGAFFPSGAGGGDVAVLLASRPEAADAFDAQALGHGYTRLSLSLDARGLRTLAGAGHLTAPFTEETSTPP